jgi:hypothetical protein
LRSKPIGSDVRLFRTADDVLFRFTMTCIELPHHQAAWVLGCRELECHAESLPGG